MKIELLYALEEKGLISFCDKYIVIFNKLENNSIFTLLDYKNNIKLKTFCINTGLNNILYMSLDEDENYVLIFDFGTIQIIDLINESVINKIDLIEKEIELELDDEKDNILKKISSSFNKKILTSVETHRLIIWDLNTFDGRVLLKMDFEQLDYDLEDFIYSSDNEHLFLNIYDIKTNKIQLYIYDKNLTLVNKIIKQDHFNKIVPLQDLKHILTTFSNTIYMQELPRSIFLFMLNFLNGEIITKYGDGYDFIYSYDYNHQRKLIAAICEIDKISYIKIWNIDTHEEIFSVPDKTIEIKFSYDGDYLFTREQRINSDDYINLKIWKIN